MSKWVQLQDKPVDWKIYNGGDEQIAELANNTFIVNNINSIFGNPKCVNTFYTGKTEEEDKLWLRGHFHEYGITKYWLIPADPLREMKVRWSMTGQPVWIKMKSSTYWVIAMRGFDLIYQDHVVSVIRSITPDWNIPNAEYSFIEFEKSVDK